MIEQLSVELPYFFVISDAMHIANIFMLRVKMFFFLVVVVCWFEWGCRWICLRNLWKFSFFNSSNEDLINYLKFILFLQKRVDKFNRFLVGILWNFKINKNDLRHGKCNWKSQDVYFEHAPTENENTFLSPDLTQWTHFQWVFRLVSAHEDVREN